MDTGPAEPEMTVHKRPWWHLHGVTWAVGCLVVVSSIYLNVNVVDALYRLKYGPVRPSILVSGWPFNAVEEDAVSAKLHVNWHSLLTNLALTLILAVGAAFRVEAWRRKSAASWRFTAEHAVTIVVIGVATLLLHAVSRSDCLVGEIIDCVDAFRWPAASILFVAFCLTCRAFVEELRLVVSRRPASDRVVLNEEP